MNGQVEVEVVDLEHDLLAGGFEQREVVLVVRVVVALEHVKG